MRSAVVLGLVAASSALAPGAHRNTLAFAGPALPLVQSHILSSQRLPALRQPRAASLKVNSLPAQTVPWQNGAGAQSAALHNVFTCVYVWAVCGWPVAGQRLLCF